VKRWSTSTLHSVTSQKTLTNVIIVDDFNLPLKTLASFFTSLIPENNTPNLPLTMNALVVFSVTVK
jgi:hypothetical protein